MKVVILVSTYNGERFLKNQIDSLLSQVGDFDIDIVFRDDGSQDRTKDILEEYSKNNSNIKWFSGTNLKPAKSFLDLLWKCGDYDFYCFCDQDDVWDDNKIEEGINQLKHLNTPGFYYSNARLVNSELLPYGVNVYKNVPCNDIFTVMCASNVIGCTMIMNNQLVSFLRNNKAPSVVSMHDSYIARVCLAIGGTIIYNHTPYMSYRQHENNVIGIKKTLVDKVKYALMKTASRPSITVDIQAQEILNLYSRDISEENKKWLNRVANYRKNILSRISLALSRKPTYSSFGMGMQMRIAILLGNR